MDKKNLKDENLERATFAGGCFWCMEKPFDQLDGVKATISGYTGGAEKDPTYGEVSSGATGHTEAVQIIYDPKKTGYSELLDVFWKNIDPTDPTGQFVDKGSQYRSGIFYHNTDQKKLAEESKKKLEQSGRFQKPIVTEITEFSAFYPAEDYHQDYYINNPTHYNTYRFFSGRDQYIEKKWGKKKK